MMWFPGIRLIDLTGRRFGRLIVLSRAPNTSGDHVMWLCQCDCGQQKVARGSHMTRWLIQSCGCWSAEQKKLRQTKHGDTPWQQPKAAEYRIWRHMKSRCLNPNVPNFKYYGGRGIRICDEWRDDYEAFLAHVGRRPSPKHSIDRINNDGHYEPGNVRWATSLQQRHNRRDSVRWPRVDGALEKG